MMMGPCLVEFLNKKVFGDAPREEFKRFFVMHSVCGQFSNAIKNVADVPIHFARSMIAFSSLEEEWMSYFCFLRRCRPLLSKFLSHSSSSFYIRRTFSAGSCSMSVAAILVMS